MIIFDTETTGLIKSMALPLDQQPEIIEVAVLRLNDDTLEEEAAWSSLVKPRRLPLEPVITKITGLTDADLADALPFAAVVDQLARFFLGERRMVGHNIAYDRDMLYNELRRIDRVTRFPWPTEHVCTVERNKPHFGGRYVKQDELYAHYFGAKPDDAHRALNDVRNLAQCLRAMRNEGRF